MLDRLKRFLTRSKANQYSDALARANSELIGQPHRRKGKPWVSAERRKKKRKAEKLARKIRRAHDNS